MSKELVDLVQNLGSPRVLVVGDAMLDRYVWGDAERISQEAPVILLRVDRREERLGGASSVATMLRALGARVMLAGVVGNDHDGGRGFGFTGYHNYSNLTNDSFRTLLLNGAAWTAKLEVPSGGIPTKTPTKDDLEKLWQDGERIPK